MADTQTVKTEAQAYIDKWQQLLGLQNWRILLNIEDKAGSGVAVTAWADGYRKVCITIYLKSSNPDAFDYDGELTGEELDKNMLHELIHLIQAPTYDLICGEIHWNSGLFARYKQAQETVVDEITSVIWRLTR